MARARDPIAVNRRTPTSSGVGGSVRRRSLTKGGEAQVRLERRYGLSAVYPGNRCAASSSENPRPIVTSSPGCQSPCGHRLRRGELKAGDHTTESTESPMTLVLRRSKSPLSRATVRSSVVQTGVKSPGWLNRDAPAVSEPVVEVDHSLGVCGEVGCVVSEMQDHAVPFAGDNDWGCPVRIAGDAVIDTSAVVMVAET